MIAVHDLTPWTPEVRSESLAVRADALARGHFGARAVLGVCTGRLDGWDSFEARRHEASGRARELLALAYGHAALGRPDITYTRGPSAVALTRECIADDIPVTIGRLVTGSRLETLPGLLAAVPGAVAVLWALPVDERALTAVLS